MIWTPIVPPLRRGTWIPAFAGMTDLGPGVRHAFPAVAG